MSRHGLVPDVLHDLLGGGGHRGGRGRGGDWHGGGGHDWHRGTAATTTATVV